MTLMAVTALLSVWAIPALLIISAFTWVNTAWLKVVCCLLALIWLLLLRPWKLFRGHAYNQLIGMIAYAIKYIFFH